MERQPWRTGVREFGEVNPGGQGQGALKGLPGGSGGAKGIPCLWFPGYVSPKLPLSPHPGLSPSNSLFPFLQHCLSQTPPPGFDSNTLSPVSAFSPQYQHLVYGAHTKNSMAVGWFKTPSLGIYHHMWQSQYLTILVLVNTNVNG